MTGKVSKEYLDLRRTISSYVDKYPTPDSDWNKVQLQRLSILKSNLDDPSLASEYYKIRDSIVLANGGFAMKYVTRYHSLMTDDVSIAELFQEATIGLIETIDAYNPEKKTAFTTYAFYHVRKRIVDFIKKNKLVKATRDIARNMKHVSDAQGYIQSTKGITPTAHDIEQYLKKEKKIKLSESTVDKIMVLLELNSSGSEDSFISEYKDQITCDDQTELFRDMELNIMSSINTLSVDSQKAICLRFGIARDYSHSPEEVILLMNIPDDHHLSLD
jgi:RNA polymerase sigma factor (sigma-70 family)